MTDKPTLLVTETSMMVIGELPDHPDLMRQWRGWIEDHGIDSSDVLADHPVTVDRARNTIAYVREYADCDSDPKDVIAPQIEDADHRAAWQAWADGGYEGAPPQATWWPTSTLEIRVVYLDRPPAPFPFALTEWNTSIRYPKSYMEYLRVR